MKKIISLMVLVCSVSLMAFVESGTKIMAVVGDEVITYNDVLKRYNVVVATNGLQVTNDQEKQALISQVLHALINEKVFVQEAKKLKIKATEEEINNVINGIEKQQNISYGHFEEFLKSKEISKTDALAQITNSIIWGKMLEQVIVPKVHVSNAELNEYVDSHFPKDLEISLYLFIDGVNKSSKSMLVDIYTKVKNCNMIDKLLSDEVKFSYIQKKFKELNPELQTRVSGMRVGQKSDIFSVKHSDEFFIICSKKSTLGFEQINNIKSMLLDKKVNQQADYYMKNLSKKTFIEIYYK